MINPTIAQLMRMMRRDSTNDCLSDHQLEIIVTDSFYDVIYFNNSLSYLVATIKCSLLRHKLTIQYYK